MKLYAYKINSDAYLTKVYATSMDDAARKLLLPSLIWQNK